jgi:hypothetical protein
MLDQSNHLRIGFSMDIYQEEGLWCNHLWYEARETTALQERHHGMVTIHSHDMDFKQQSP